MTAHRLLVSVAIATTALASVASVVRAQQPNTGPDVLSALLIEVRGLRSAMEQMASAGPRVQLALGRLQLQEQRISNMVRRLEAVRSSLPDAQDRLEEFQQRVNDLEDMRRGDPNISSIDHQLRKWKENVARASADVQRIMSEEVTLGQEIAAEQARWSEINQRLEELERTLVRK